MSTQKKIIPANLKVVELKVELVARKLPTKGIKKDLVARLEEALKAEAENNSPAGTDKDGISLSTFTPEPATPLVAKSLSEDQPKQFKRERSNSPAKRVRIDPPSDENGNNMIYTTSNHVYSTPVEDSEMSDIVKMPKLPPQSEILLTNDEMEERKVETNVTLVEAGKQISQPLAPAEPLSSASRELSIALESKQKQEQPGEYVRSDVPDNGEEAENQERKKRKLDNQGGDSDFDGMSSLSAQDGLNESSKNKARRFENINKISDVLAATVASNLKADQQRQRMASVMTSAPDENNAIMTNNMEEIYPNTLVALSIHEEQQPPINVQDQRDDTSSREGTNAIYIKGFVRPLTIPQVRQLVEPHGTLVRFWMDSIKTHCYVVYSNIASAQSARNNIHNITFPPETGRLLYVDYLTSVRVDELISLEEKAQQERTKINWEKLLNGNMDMTISDLSKLSKSKAFEDVPTAPAAMRRTRQTAIPSIPATSTPSQPKPPVKVLSLDELFSKTTAKPMLYYKQLSDEEAKMKRERLFGSGGSKKEPQSQ